MNLFKKSYIKWLVAAVLLATAIFLFIYTQRSYSAEDIRRSVVLTEHHYVYTIKSGDSPILYFTGITNDSLLLNPSEGRNEVIEKSLGCWINSSSFIPSCHGRMATVFTRNDTCVLNKDFMRNILNEEAARCANLLFLYEHSNDEVQYYIDTHCEKDEGYADVIKFRDSLLCERERIARISSLVKKAYGSKSLSIVREEKFYVTYKDIDNKTVRKQCNNLPASNDCGNYILQVCDSITPKGVVPLNMWSIHPLNLTEKDTVMVMGCSYINETNVNYKSIGMIPECLNGDTLSIYPHINISKGAPVFTRNGVFVGIIGGKTIVRRNQIRKSL